MPTMNALHQGPIVARALDHERHVPTKLVRLRR